MVDVVAQTFAFARVALPRVTLGSKLAPKAAAGCRGRVHNSSPLAFAALRPDRGCVLALQLLESLVALSQNRNAMDSVRIRAHNLFSLFKHRKQYHILCWQQHRRLCTIICQLFGIPFLFWTIQTQLLQSLLFLCLPAAVWIVLFTCHLLVSH